MDDTTTPAEPGKYFRTGIAIPWDRKEIMLDRLQQLGLTTIGDLVTMFILAPGIVETLKETAARHLETKATPTRAKALRQKLGEMSPAELERLIALAELQRS